MNEQDCQNCEAELMLELSSLTLRLDTAKGYIKILERCLDSKEILCNYYRTQMEELTTRIKYLEEAKNETKS